MNSTDIFKRAERIANAAMMKELQGQIEEALMTDPSIADVDKKHSVEKASSLKGYLDKIAEWTDFFTPLEQRRMIPGENKSRNTERYREEMAKNLAYSDGKESMQDIINRVNKGYAGLSYSDSGLNDPRALFSDKENNLSKMLLDNIDAIGAGDMDQKSTGGLTSNILKGIDRLYSPTVDNSNARNNAEYQYHQNADRRMNYLTQPSPKMIAGK